MFFCTGVVFTLLNYSLTKLFLVIPRNVHSRSAGRVAVQLMKEQGKSEVGSSFVYFVIILNSISSYILSSTTIRRHLLNCL